MNSELGSMRRKTPSPIDAEAPYLMQASKLSRYKIWGMRRPWGDYLATAVTEAMLRDCPSTTAFLSQPLPVRSSSISHRERTSRPWPRLSLLSAGIEATQPVDARLLKVPGSIMAGVSTSLETDIASILSFFLTERSS